MTNKGEINKSLQDEVDRVNTALNVDGYSNPIGAFYDDIFLLDHWTEDEGLCYLLGILSIQPYGNYEDGCDLISTLDGFSYHEHEDLAVVSEFRAKFRRLERVWKSGLFPEINPPSFYIEWALSKGINIPWLKFATENGFYELPQNNSKKKELSDELSSKEYTSMLKIILALAENVYKYPERGALKEMIEDFERNDNGVSEKTLKKYLDEATKL